MLGSFAEYFSGTLANHVSKGLDQRAIEGKHTGGIPFDYGHAGQAKKVKENDSVTRSIREEFIFTQKKDL